MSFDKLPDETLADWIDRASATCDHCHQRFTHDEWANQHWEGAQIFHAHCCPVCSGGGVVGWIVVDRNHPDGRVVFPKDCQTDAVTYAAINGCDDPSPILDEELYG